MCSLGRADEEPKERNIISSTLIMRKAGAQYCWEWEVVFANWRTLDSARKQAINMDFL